MKQTFAPVPKGRLINLLKQETRSPEISSCSLHMGSFSSRKKQFDGFEAPSPEFEETFNN